MDQNSDSVGEKGKIPSCPHIKFKETPPYKVTHELIEPTRLVNEGGPNCNMNKAQFSFDLTPSQATEILELRNKKDEPFPSIKLLLRFCALDEGKKEQEDMFPPGLEVFLNGTQPVPLTTNPLDISKYVGCDLHSSNTLTVVWLESPGNGHYYIALHVVKSFQLPADDTGSGDGELIRKDKHLSWKRNGIKYVLAKPSAGQNTFGFDHLKRTFKRCPERHGIIWSAENAVVSKSSPEDGKINMGLRKNRIPGPSSSSLRAVKASRLENIGPFQFNGKTNGQLELDNTSFEVGNAKMEEIFEPNRNEQVLASSSMSSQGSSQEVPNWSGAEPEPMYVVPPNKKRKGLPCSSSGSSEMFVDDLVTSETLSSVGAQQLSLEFSCDGVTDVTSLNEDGNDMPSPSKQKTMEPELGNDDEEISHLAFEIHFRDKADPEETFSMKFNAKSSYFDMAIEVGKKLGADPEYIQFFKSNSNKNSQGRGRPTRLSQDDEELLRKLTRDNSPILGTYKLLYEVLQIPASDQVNKKRFKIRFYSPQDKGEREVVVFVNKSPKITAKDVLLEVSKAMSGRRVMTLRMVKIFRSQITNIVDNDFCADFNYSDMSMSGYYRAEEIPRGEENLTENEVLVPVAHFNKEVRSTFGMPFLIKVCFGETWLSLKKKIQTRLGIKKREWSKIKIALVTQRSMRYFEKDEDNVPISREHFVVKTRSTDGFKNWIGLDHPFDGPTELIE